LLDDIKQLDNEKFQRQFLGFSFKELTSKLCENWSLGGSLATLLFPDRGSVKNKPHQAINALGFASEIVLLLHKGSEEQINALVQQIADYYQLEKSDIEDVIENSKKETVTMLMSHGSKKLGKHVSDIQDVGKYKTGKTSVSVNDSKIDKQLQTDVIQDLKDFSQEKFEINTLFHIVLEGLHRALGFERVAIALFDQTHSFLTAKYQVGRDQQAWKEKFTISVTENDSEFAYCIKQKRAITIEGIDNKPNSLGYLGTTFVAPVMKGERVLGVYYADSGNDQPVDIEIKKGFYALCTQANQSLTKGLE